MRPRLIYNLCRRGDWEEAQRHGAYRGSADDRRDGFIHLSTAAQVAESAARHRAGVSDLLLLTVDTRRLGDGLRWEPARGGALFPHLHGPLAVDAVVKVEALGLGPAGHVFPPLSDG